MSKIETTVVQSSVGYSTVIGYLTLSLGSNFQWTHEAAVEDVKYLLATRTGLKTQQLDLLQELVDELYTQHSPVKLKL